jgi:hypothetical protein
VRLIGRSLGGAAQAFEWRSQSAIDSSWRTSRALDCSHLAIWFQLAQVWLTSSNVLIPRALNLFPQSIERCNVIMVAALLLTLSSFGYQAGSSATQVTETTLRAAASVERLKRHERERLAVLCR